MDALLIRVRRLALVLLAAFYGAAPLTAPAADLPVACGAGACAGGPSVWVTQGAATSALTGNRLDVNQTSDKAVLNWAEFNVAAGKEVKFNQPGKDSLALNKIYQNDPSKIYGALTANGQVYLINQNGILFGKGAQVNVGSLVASSLGVDPAAEENGILDPNILRAGKAAFAGDGRVYVLDQNGQVVLDANGAPIPVKVAVEQGATLASDPQGGGRIALLGQDVENAGTLKSPSGQVVLAAGQKVYLQASTDPALRGLLVEVDAGGKAWNQATGQVSSPLGNVSLVGLAVNQDGRVSATTSVRQNGSVRLLARDTVEVQVGLGETVNVNTRRAGTVSLGGGSVTEALPDAQDGKTAVDDQAQALSSVELVGRQIDLASGSLVHVPGGNVSLTALPDPSVDRPASQPLPVDAESRIRLAAGARIDVSGSEATVAGDRNYVEVQLRANELKDAPLQRDGALRGQTAVVDARTGTSLADVSGAVGTIQRDVFERTAKGGTVTLRSQGDVVAAAGSTIDVSGGAVHYTAAVDQSSLLIRSDGRAVNIADADPNQVYIGVHSGTYSVVHRKWGFEERATVAGISRIQAGYTEGADAGTVNVAAPGLALSGDLLGLTLPGPLQRAAADRPLGGRLVVGLADGQGLPTPDFRAPSVRFTSASVPVDVSPDEPLPAEHDTLELSTDYLRSGGFTRTEIYSNGVISLDAGTDLDLAGGSSLLLRGSQVNVDGNISAPGGSVGLSAVTVNPGARRDTGQRPGVRLGDGVRVDVSGQWINEQPGLGGYTSDQPLFIHGGSVALDVAAQEGELVVGDHVGLHADAGAVLAESLELATGKAGSISLRASGPYAALATGRNLDLSAWGFTGGGSLTLGANQLRVVSGGQPFASGQRSDPTASGTVPYALSTGLFGLGGFQNFQLVATGTRLTGEEGSNLEPLAIAGDAVVAPQLQLRTVDARSATNVVTGSAISSFASTYLPVATERPAGTLSFSVEPHALVTGATAGDLHAEAGSRIVTDAGGRVSFSAPTRVRLDGQVTAPGGEITARLVTPGSALDAGFDPGVGIFLGSGASLDATGTVLLQPSDLGLRQGTVLDGGSITLQADRGTVGLAAGSRLDVSGTATELELPTGVQVSGSPVLARRPVASAGGTISLVAPESLDLFGTLRGASGAPGAEVRPAGGTLAIGISRQRGFNTNQDLQPTYPTTPRQILVATTPASAEGDPNGTLRLNPGLAAAGGFDSLALQADDKLVFGSDVDLRLVNQLLLQAPNLVMTEEAGLVTLRANYLALGSQLTSGPAPSAATDGRGRLIARANVVDVFGRVASQGVGDFQLTAGTDLRFTGVRTQTSTLQGGLTTGRDLLLRAAQVYPTTDSQITVIAGADGGGRLEIQGSGQAPGPVYSAGGSLTLRADEIRQGGVLKAPLGQLELVAGERLTLADGSLTSTSAEGLTIPYGRVVGGTQWVYEPQAGILRNINTPPEKRVSLTGQDVAVADGAVIDVSGGGDLYAYEFLPGPGGSIDALAPAANPNLYAIIPGLGGYAPYDTQEYADSGLVPGDSVVLGEIPGLLKAGTYALLPARYALLPGALLVEAVDSTPDLPLAQTRRQSDGATVVGGYRSVGGTTLRDSRSGGFVVRPGSYARQLAEYKDYSGNQFFAARAAARDEATPRLPGDAGTLQFSVGEALTLEGSLRASAANGGRGAQVDLSAAALRVVTSLGNAVAGVVEVTADALNDLGAESLLLGGRRSAGTDADTTDLAVTAGTVTVAGGAQVSAPEIILAARDQVSLEENAALLAEGTAAADEPRTLRLTETAGGALVRVSRAAQAEVQRTGSAATGDVLIGTGASLSAPGSIAVDGAGSVGLFGNLAADGAALSLGSARITLGAEQSATDDGLTLSDARLRGFRNVNELRLAGRESIRVAADLDLSDELLPALILDTPLLNASAGGGNAGRLRLAADRVTLTNSTGTQALIPVAGTGELSLAAGEMRLGNGQVALGGFATTRFDAGSVLTEDQFSLATAGDLVVATPRLAGEAGSTLRITASGGSVSLVSAGGAAPAGDAGLGAALEVEAEAITVDTSLAYPSGRVRLAAESSLLLNSGAQVNLAGRQLRLADAELQTPGGEAVLVARQGNLKLAPGASIDVSAGGDRVDAGRIAALVGGEADLGGTLVAGRDGEFALTTGTLADFTGLLGQWATGGFTRSVSLETRSGDLTLAADESITAQAVTLAASGGQLRVDGRVDARAAGGGQAVLAAGDGLILGATAEVLAANTAASGEGGEITLIARDGAINFETDTSGRRAALDVAGPGGAAAGTVLLRATATDTDVSIGSLDALITGAAKVIVEPVIRKIASHLIDDFAIAEWRAALDGFLVNAAAGIRTRLGLDSLPGGSLRPGLEVMADGDLTLVTNWDLAGWDEDRGPDLSPDAEPGYLTVRSTGNLSLQGNLSDIDPRILSGSVSEESLPLLQRDTWSYRLVAGADLASALPTAVKGRLLEAGDTGSLELGDGYLVRTGTGSIEMAADQDLVLAGPLAAIYTYGVPVRRPLNLNGDEVLRRNWLRDGGDLRLSAGRDIRALAAAQVLGGWNVRTASDGQRAQWSVDIERFRYGIGALGGGDIVLTAGRDLADLSVVIPTTSVTLPNTGAVFESDGGNLLARAGRDIRSGAYSVWKGSGRLWAGDSLVLGEAINGSEVRTILGFGESDFVVTARRNLDLEGAVNGTTVAPINAESPPFFYLYSPGSRLQLQALGGDLRLFNNRSNVSSAAAAETPAFGIYPATLKGYAPSGDIHVLGPMALLPAPAGQLDLVAAGSLRAADSTISVVMSDSSLSRLPLADTFSNNLLDPVQDSAADGIHVGDDLAARLVAAGGDLVGGIWQLAKHVQAIAARDIRQLTITAQNTDPAQVSLVQAGRDIYLPDATNGIELGGPGRLMVLAGRNVDLGYSRGITTIGRNLTPGLSGSSGAALDLWAGLGSLPDYAGFNNRYWDGEFRAELADYADSLVPYVAGLTGRTDLNADNVWAAYAQLGEDQQEAYVNGGLIAATDRPADQAVRQNAFRTFTPLVDNLVGQVVLVTGSPVTGPTEALDRYVGLAVNEQRPLVQDYLFRTLRDSGREANLDPALGFRRGQEAVLELFPEAGSFAGDLSLVFSRLYTLAGGDINLLVPGGLLNVGLALPPANLPVTKNPSDLGIVAQGTGDVRIFSDGDVLVNQSRVFTLQGGDIVIWSSNGNIDAGRGSKSAISAPPPTLTVTASGLIQVSFSDAIAGSGIRGILTDESLEPGDVDLIAPTGEVNAGDAGIGSAGNLNIAAPQVVGIDNIQVAGVSTGVPTDSGVAASLTGVSSLAASANEASEASTEESMSPDANPMAEAAMGWLEVFVEGFGDGSDEDEDEAEKKGRGAP